MTIVGYARVSTADQSLDLQTDALTKAGCERIFTDIASGARDDRPGLAKALATLQPGDVLAIYKLDRLGRSMRHLVETVAGLEQRGVGLKVLTGNIDTTSAAGRLVFGIFASLAEFERELIRERTLAGLAAAKARGKLGGRRPKLTTMQVAHARELLAAKTSIKQIAAILGCARSTLYAALDRAPSNPTRVAGQRKPRKTVAVEMSV